jgi:amino acid permease
MASRGERSRAWKATFILFGTIVGAGIFGLPALVQKSGFAIGAFWMIALAGVVSLTHLLYAEIVMATPERHRLVGYVRFYLGRTVAQVEAVNSTLNLYGGSLAYLILGGLFAAAILSPLMAISPIYGSAALFLFGLAAAWGGARFLSKFDFAMTIGELTSFLVLAGVAFSAFKASNLAGADFSQAFLPYGVVLFAYGGLTAVPEVADIVGGDRRQVRRSVVIGTLMAAGLTFLFAMAVVAALGPDVTPESLAGLTAKFGGVLPVLGGVTGFLSILTSYAVFGSNLKSQFQFDLKLKPLAAVFAAVVLPFLLFLLGIRSFGRILEFVGAVMIGLEGIFVALVYLKAKARYPDRILKVPTPLIYLLIMAYLAGMAYEILHRAL